MVWLKRKNKRDNIPRRRQTGGDAQTNSAKNTGRSLFRRNRTLVGSLSSRIKSANELDAALKSPRTHTHHLTAYRRKLGSMFITVVAVASFLTWFLYEFTADIKLEPTQNVVITQSNRYVNPINDYLASHPFERLRPLLNKTDLTLYLRQVVPEVQYVPHIETDGFVSTSFSLTFRQPVASWLIGKDQYYVDKQGVGFRINHFKEPEVKIVDKSGISQTGAAIASTRFLQFVGLTVDTAQEYGLQVKQAIIPHSTTRQIELRIAKHSYPIKLSLDRPVGEQVEDMKRAVQYLDKKGVTPKYIDVRVSGRAYYK